VRKKTLNRNKTLANFQPKYNEVTAIDRKFKEFHKDYHNKNKYNGNVQHNVEKITNNKAKINNINNNSTAKERKLKELNPNLNINESNLRNTIPATTSNANNSNIEKKKEEVQPREQIVIDITSNTNKPDDKDLKQNKVEIKKEKEIKALEKKNFGLKSNSDIRNWKTLKTEMVKSEENSGKKLNPKDRRLNDIYNSNFICQTENNIQNNDGNLNNLKSSFNTIATETVTINDEELNISLQNSLRETISNKTTLKRNLDNISSSQNKEELIKILKESNRKDRKVEEYTIDNINYDDFNLKEFKSIFSKKGIHLFSVDFTGNYANGNSNGKLTYKIRKTNENKNLQEVNQQISNNLKLNVKVNQDKKENKTNH